MLLNKVNYLTYIPGKINKKVMVLSSCELPVKTGDRTPGSTAFVPSSAGLLISSYIIREFLGKLK